jgi:hypothetical protein
MYGRQKGEDVQANFRHKPQTCGGVQRAITASAGRLGRPLWQMLSGKPVRQRILGSYILARLLRDSFLPLECQSAKDRKHEYTVIFAANNDVGARLAYALSAVQALAMIELHQACGEVVRSIRSH